MTRTENSLPTLTSKGLAEALTTALEVAPCDIPAWADTPDFPYELLSPVARGGQGEVWQARCRDSGQLIALKILHLHSSSPDLSLAHFRNEVQALESLDHPHITPVICHGEAPDSGIAWLAMPWIEGGSLADLARSLDTPIPWQTLRPLALQASQSLHNLHRQGLIHRDLKPSNLLLNKNHTHLWITDFGMVSDAKRESTEQNNLTPYTPGYCAPELLEGRTKASTRSDQFSLAATLWHLLTGRLPLGEIRRPDHPLPPGLEKVLRKALSSRPEERYPDLQQFARALASPPKNRKPVLIGIAALLGITFLITTFRPDQKPPAPAPPPLPPSLTFESGRIPVTGNDQAFMEITAVVHRDGQLKVTYLTENKSLLQGVTTRALVRLLDSEGNELFAALSTPWGVNGILIPGMENTRTEYNGWSFDPAIYPQIHEARFEAHEALHAAEDRTKAFWRDLKRDLKKITE